MQKTILNIKEDNNVQEAIVKNRENALCLALLLSYGRAGEIKFDDLMLDLCEFSYKGDIRMIFKMENPDKVKNIVSAQIDFLWDIYSPILKKFEEAGWLKIVDNSRNIFFKHNRQTLQEMLDAVPDSIKSEMNQKAIQLPLTDL